MHVNRGGHGRLATTCRREVVGAAEVPQPLLDGGGDGARVGARAVELAQELRVGDLAGRVGHFLRFSCRQDGAKTCSCV